MALDLLRGGDHHIYRNPQPAQGTPKAHTFSAWRFHPLLNHQYIEVAIRVWLSTGV